MLFCRVQRKGDFLAFSDQRLIDEELHAIVDLDRTEGSGNESIIGGFGLGADPSIYEQWTDDATTQRLAKLAAMHPGKAPLKETSRRPSIRLGAIYRMAVVLTPDLVLRSSIH